jgi:nickel-dependent lactate racemase
MTWSIQNSERALDENEIRATMARAFDSINLRGKRVLVIIPDGTRSGPLGLFYKLFVELLKPHTAALDFLIALGTHPEMDDAHIAARLDTSPGDWRARGVNIFNHAWWKPETFFTAGTIAADEIAQITNGMLSLDVPVTLNKKILEYDVLLVCGPVFPHEVVGMSGGSKYLFPGIAGAEIINVTHWIGALLTSYAVIGTKHTAVRAVIERAAQMVNVPKLGCCFVVHGDGVEGVHIGDLREAWSAAADQSAQSHIVYLDQPLPRVLSVMPRMYDDIWTAAKGMYKMEPAIADGGEVIIYAPHITEFSYTHGKHIEAIGYHVRDYFVKQWDKFKHQPWGTLAHSTHLRGIGKYDVTRGIESPRIRVTLATQISRERCERVNLGYFDPRDINPDEWRDRAFVVPKAGEMLYHLKSTVNSKQ